MELAEALGVTLAVARVLENLKIPYLLGGSTASSLHGILKQGRPVARLLPPVPAGEGYPQRSLRGSVETLGDILEPVFPSEAWEALGGRDED